ncbi:DcaP family trimeric outer membrane transporter [Seongchinamella sediminis]|nr:DcaP family trimeric outer membrane transporter [Seongchinamella sediminis]
MRKATALLFASLLVLSPLSTLAASDTERIQMLEQQLRQQQQVLDAMRQELERLKAGEDSLVQAGTAAPGEQDRARAEQEPELAQTRGDASLNVYGHIQLDAIYDFKRVDPTWESTLRPSTIPTVEDTFGADGNTIISVKQTQFGFKGTTPTPLGEMKSWFEFDFFGTGSDAGDTKFNLRHAWIELGSLGFGQTNSNFMDISIFPNVVDWWGPAGMVFNRNAQIRYSWAVDDSAQFAIAAEKPNGSFNSGEFGEISPGFDDIVKARTRYPDITARWRDDYDWGHYQVAAVLRYLEIEARGIADAPSPENETGWGINLTGVINTVGRDQLKLGLVHGEGIASFFNDGGVNLAPEDNRAEAVPITGVTAYYDRYWSSEWSSSIGFSVNDADPRKQQAADEFDSGVYASVNLLYTPYPELLIGPEFLYGKHEDVGGRSGEDYRLQFTLKHKLGRTF